MKKQYSLLLICSLWTAPEIQPAYRDPNNQLTIISPNQTQRDNSFGPSVESSSLPQQRSSFRPGSIKILTPNDDPLEVSDDRSNLSAAAGQGLGSSTARRKSTSDTRRQSLQIALMHLHKLSSPNDQQVPTSPLLEFQRGHSSTPDVPANQNYEQLSGFKFGESTTELPQDPMNNSEVQLRSLSNDDDDDTSVVQPPLSINDRRQSVAAANRAMDLEIARQAIQQVSQRAGRNTSTPRIMIKHIEIGKSQVTSNDPEVTGVSPQRRPSPSRMIVPVEHMALGCGGITASMLSYACMVSPNSLGHRDISLDADFLGIHALSNTASLALRLAGASAAFIAAFWTIYKTRHWLHSSCRLEKEILEERFETKLRDAEVKLYETVNLKNREQTDAINEILDETFDGIAQQLNGHIQSQNRRIDTLTAVVGSLINLVAEHNNAHDQHEQITDEMRQELENSKKALPAETMLQELEYLKTLVCQVQETNKTDQLPPITTQPAKIEAPTVIFPASKTKACGCHCAVS